MSRLSPTGFCFRRGGGVFAHDTRLPCGLLASQVSDLLDRDITPNDYEMLLMLDESVKRPSSSETNVKSLPVVQAEGHLEESCTICMSAFKQQDVLTELQCKHLFHRECVSKWLLERSRHCPLCGDEAFPED